MDKAACSVSTKDTTTTISCPTGTATYDAFKGLGSPVLTVAGKEGNTLKLSHRVGFGMERYPLIKESRRDGTQTTLEWNHVICHFQNPYQVPSVSVLPNIDLQLRTEAVQRFAEAHPDILEAVRAIPALSAVKAAEAGQIVNALNLASAPKVTKRSCDHESKKAVAP